MSTSRLTWAVQGGKGFIDVFFKDFKVNKVTNKYCVRLINVSVGSSRPNLKLKYMFQSQVIE